MPEVETIFNSSARSRSTFFHLHFKSRSFRIQEWKSGQLSFEIGFAFRYDQCGVPRFPRIPKIAWSGGHATCRKFSDGTLPPTN